MRKLAFALMVSVAALAAPALGQTTEYNRIQRSYTADNVLAVLGKPVVPSPGQQRMTVYDVQAGINTNVSCGQLRVNFNFGEMINTAKKIPKQLAGQAQNLIGGLPMLILCQSSPSLCAEIKNLNYQINEELGALSDTCRAMDSYIDSRAREGRARGWRDCVSRNYNGGNLANAQQTCNEDEPHPLYTDMARGWAGQHLTNAPQRLLGSLLEASGENLSSALGAEKYHFLSSVMGEFKLDVNGTKLPLIRPMPVVDLGKDISNDAIGLACDAPRLRRTVNNQAPAPNDTDAMVRAREKKLQEVVKEKVPPEAVNNLEILDTVDFRPACNALGRSMGRETLDRLRADLDTQIGRITANPGLEPELRQDILERRAVVAAAMDAYKFQGGANQTVDEVLAIIQQMAETTRERIRQDVAAAARGKLRLWQEMGKTRCTGPDSCN